MVFGSTADFSGGGVMVAGVLSFLDGPSGVPPHCFRFCFDLVISLRADVKYGRSEETERRIINFRLMAGQWRYCKTGLEPTLF